MPASVPDDIKQSYKLYIPGTIVRKAFLLPLGYLTVWAAQMEQAIDETCIKLFSADHPDKGLIITAGKQALGTKLSLLRALASLCVLNDKAIRELNKICSDAELVISGRNKLIHGRWMGGSTTMRTSLKVSYEAKSKLTFVHSIFTPEQVKEKAELALGVSDRLYAFFSTHPNWAKPQEHETKSSELSVRKSRKSHSSRNKRQSPPRSSQE